MDSKQNENLGLAIVIVALGFIGMFVFALLAFLAIILTLVAFYSWNKPRKFGSVTIEPKDAREFVFGGIAGAFLVGVFVQFAAALWDLQIDWDQVGGYIVFGGYIIGSFLPSLAQANEQQAPPEDVPVPFQRLPPPAPEQPERPERDPFRFASWDDEEEGR